MVLFGAWRLDNQPGNLQTRKASRRNPAGRVGLWGQIRNGWIELYTAHAWLDEGLRRVMRICSKPPWLAIKARSMYVVPSTKGDLPVHRTIIGITEEDF